MLNIRKIKCGVREMLAEGIKRQGCYRFEVKRLFSAKDCESITLVDFNETCGKSDLREEAVTARFGILSRKASSSGTSGSPFVFPQPFSALQREQAFIDYLWGKLDYRLGDRVAVMRGGDLSTTCLRVKSRLVISGRGWSDTEISHKLHNLKTFKPKFIHCYPSVLERFIKRVIALDLALPQGVSGVLCGSEECNAHQIQLFEDALGAQTLAWYGQSEQVVLAVRESNGDYAVVPGYSEVGFLKREDGYEIVGKSKSNPFFAHNWYRTGDYCKSIEVAHSKVLGVDTLILTDLQGRSSKSLRLADGSLVPFNQILFGYHSHLWRLIDRYCFVQINKGELLFVYALTVNESVKDLGVFLAQLENQFPKGIEFRAMRDETLKDLVKSKWLYFFSSREQYSRFRNDI